MEIRSVPWTASQLQVIITIHFLDLSFSLCDRNPQRSDRMLRECRERIQTLRYSPKKAPQSSILDNCKRKPTRATLRKTVKKARTATTLNEELDNEDKQEEEEEPSDDDDDESEVEVVPPKRTKKAQKEPPPRRIQPSRKKAPPPKLEQAVSASQVALVSTDSVSPRKFCNSICDVL